MTPTFRTRVLTLSAAALTAAASVAALAATDPAAKPPTAVKTAPPSATAYGANLSAADREKLQALTRDASTMLAHSGIAAIALSADLRDIATANIDAALKIADKLAGDTAKINAEHPLLAARFTDQSKSGAKNYWLPLPDEKLTVRQLDEVLARRQPDRIEETGLQSMRMHMFLDTGSVQRELRRAKTAMDEGNYGIARDAIRIAQLSSLSETTETAEPLERARDNLVLARELSAQKNYASARRTLEYAKAELDTLQASDAKFKSDPSAVRLQADMDALAKSLGRKEPGAFDRAYADIGRWVGQLDDWIKARTPK